jgi:hypothetical protein
VRIASAWDLELSLGRTFRLELVEVRGMLAALGEARPNWDQPNWNQKLGSAKRCCRLLLWSRGSSPLLKGVLPSIIEAFISRRCFTLSYTWVEHGKDWVQGEGAGGADGVRVDGVGVGVSGAMQGLGKN